MNKKNLKKDKVLWRNIYEILRDRIESNEYAVGAMMPPELKLTEEFGVSRMTIRLAMNKLEKDNYIERHRGIGTIVIEPKSELSTTFESSFEHIHERNNKRLRKIRSVSVVDLPEAIQNFFECDNSQGLCLIRESYIDEKIVTYYKTYINPIVNVDADTDFTGSFYAVLENHEYEITSVSEEISARISNDDDKETFRLANDEAIVKRIRKGYHDETPIEYTDSKYLATGYKLLINTK